MEEIVGNPMWGSSKEFTEGYSCHQKEVEEKVKLFFTE